MAYDFASSLLNAARADAESVAEIEKIKTATSAAGIPLTVRLIDTSYFPAESQWATSAVLIRPDQHVGLQGDDLACVMDAMRLCLASQTGSLV